MPITDTTESHMLVCICYSFTNTETKKGARTEIYVSVMCFWYA